MSSIIKLSQYFFFVLDGRNTNLQHPLMSFFEISRRSASFRNFFWSSSQSFSLSDPPPTSSSISWRVLPFRIVFFLIDSERFDNILLLLLAPVALRFSTRPCAIFFKVDHFPFPNFDTFPGLCRLFAVPGDPSGLLSPNPSSFGIKIGAI